jgi:hypothetical protein
MRGWVCHLQLLLVLASTVILGCNFHGTHDIFYCLKFEIPPTWRARSRYSYPPEIGWPSYTPRHWVPFSLPPMTASAQGWLILCSWLCYYIDVGHVCCQLVFTSCSALNIGLCVSMFVSFICNLILLILYMWYFPVCFKCFLHALTMSTVSVIVPYLCPVFNMWLEYRELLLLFLIISICSSSQV